MAQTASVLPAIAHLNKRRIVLASGSPRRKEILENLGLNFEVIASTFPENLDKLSMNADTYVLETAIAKGCEVHQRTQSAVNGQMTISADTVIAHKSRILEKPRNREHAVEILRALSGGVHQVLTAVVVVYGLDPADQKTPLYATSVQTTEVEFAELSEEMIEAYVATGEPMDKAGAYGYQGLAACFIPRITGCYYNVIGFPINAFITLVSKLQSEGHIP